MPYCHSSAILGAVVCPRGGNAPPPIEWARESFSHLPTIVSNHNPRQRGQVVALFCDQAPSHAIGQSLFWDESGPLQG